MRGGQTIIDTEHVLLVHRRGRPLSYAFPADEVGELAAEPLAEAPGFVLVPWDAADTWVEEGRHLVHYPPNPYHRVDCRPGHRRLRVSIGDTVLVDCADTVAVFETSLPPRLYVSPTQVRTDLLRPSATTSYCNYKGTAVYWSVDGADVAWSYPEPLPESALIAGLLSFDGERVQVWAELPNDREVSPWAS